MTETKQAEVENQIVADIERLDTGEELLQIEEAARRTGLTSRTLRYYEERGLVVPARRGDSNYRLYSGADIERIERIKQLKDLLAFSLDEIGELLEVEEQRVSLKQAFKLETDRAIKSQQLRQAILLTHRELSLIDDKLHRLEKLKQDALARIARHQHRLTELEA